MAYVLGKDLDKWDDSLTAREPYALTDESPIGAQYITGTDLLRSAKITSEWKQPVAMMAQAASKTAIPGQIASSFLYGASDSIAELPYNLENAVAQRAVELVTGKESEKSDLKKLWEGTEFGKLEKTAATLLSLGVIIPGLREEAKVIREKAKTYDEMVDLLKDREYPLAKYAQRVIADNTSAIENRRLVRELYNQAQGIDSSAWYNKAATIIGAMTPTIAVSRLGYSAAKNAGATRLGAIKRATDIAQGYIGAEMAGQYAEETAAQYLQRTGDKTFSNFMAKDASGLSAIAYGAIGSQIEFLGGVEPIMAGALQKVGLRSGLLKAGVKIGAGEAVEEFLQGITETLMRKMEGSTDKTWKDGIMEALNGAAWGLFIGGATGSPAFYVNRRNLVKGIKQALPNISDAQATQVADAMIDSVGEASSQDNSLRQNLRDKVATMYEKSDIENKEDRIDAITDLEYSLIAADAAWEGIDIAEHPLFKGEVTPIGWFRAGISENVRPVVEGLITELNDLQTQLKTLNEAKEKDWEKIDEIERKLDAFDRYVLDKLGTNAPASMRDLENELRKVEGKYVSKEKKKAGIKVPTDWFTENITKGNTFTTEEGTFTEYQLKGDKRNMATFTVFESPDGWIVRNAYVPESMQKKGAATNFYEEMNKKSLDKTGNPLRSTQPRILKSGEIVFELSDAGKKLWESLERKGIARKLEDNTYTFVKAQPLLQDEVFKVADENARLDAENPVYEGETINIDGKERTVYNSNGDRIAKSKEALTNFWRWFGDSKVVDEQGRPLVVYHGTPLRNGAEFDVFRKDKQAGGDYGNGFYFADKIEFAEKYTARQGKRNYKGEIEGTIYQVYLSISNPLVVSADNNFYTQLYKKYPQTKSFNSNQIQDFIQKQGFDGILAQGIQRQNQYIVFDPTQIKSTDNRGTYDSRTPNIYYQAAYAGSRVDYDQPSLEAIGSGEGNQAHGWGLYYALNPEIANRYREVFIEQSAKEFNVFVNNKRISPEVENLLNKHFYSTMYRASKNYDLAPLKNLIKETITDYEKGDYLEIISGGQRLIDQINQNPKMSITQFEASLENNSDKYRWKNLIESARKKAKSENRRANISDVKEFIELHIEPFIRSNELHRKDAELLKTLDVDNIALVERKGQVHEVDIPEMDVLLDEQKMLIDQSEFVQKKIWEINDKLNLGIKDSGIRGGEIYQRIANAMDEFILDEDGNVKDYNDPYKQASQYLDKEGIKGITYDGRQDGRCFVIFNPESVKVLRKKFDELGNALFQNRVSGAAPSTYRGAYIPQYRFIQRTNKMDATTLSHELAHDWFEVNFDKYRSGNAPADFMRAWGALEQALGVPEDAKVAPRKASEAFARAYEGWIMDKSDWTKAINVDDKDKDAIVKLMQDYQNNLRDIYQDLTNPYFKQTWGKLGELKPELVKWFDKVTNIRDLDILVDRGEMTEGQAAQEKLNRAIDTVIENTEDAETARTLKNVRTLNDTSRYEVEGGNKNALQRRIGALAQAIDENNMLIKENYDTRRDMLEVAKQADNFVRTRLDDALAIINGQMAEQEGLFKEDIYTALERLALEEGDLNLLDELKNSEIANRLAKELGQRVAGFRNWSGGDMDVVSSLKALDNKFNKALENKKAKAQMTEAENLFAKAQEEQDKLADKQLDSFLKDLECK